jgi:transcriptional regulator with XRE-family HTH domain
MNRNNDTVRQPTLLEDVLDEYVLAVQQPNQAALVEWVARYPQYEDELTNFTVEWARVEHAPDAPAESPALVEAAAERHMAMLRERGLLYAVDGAAALAGLVEEAEANGLTKKQLAERAGLTVPLLTKLDRRLIRFASIPGEVVSRIAAALDAQADAVAAYLQGGPRLAQAVSYKAEEAPTLPEPQDFVDAVRDDPVLTPEQRAELLSLASDHGQAG